MVDNLADLNIKDDFYFQWHITESCNWSCKHCYQNTHKSDDLPLAKLTEIFRRIEDAVNKWGKHGTVSFTGGEPFLRKKELHELMTYLDKSDYFAYYDILTNGSLISKNEAKKLTTYKKLRRVQVSLEGATPETNDQIRGSGSFNSISKAINNLREQNIDVSVMMTITRKNKDEIPALIEILGSMGVQALALERFVPEGRGIKMKDLVLDSYELRDLYKNIYRMAVNAPPLRILLYRPLFNLVGGDDPTVGALCSAGNNALTIMPDGTVFPCRRLPLPIGNILSDGLYKIWYGSEVLWTLRDPGNLKGKCHDCEFLTRCRGCRAMAYFMNGDYMAEDPQCWK
jgi:radical SAM protein with 4Fe4S-binding SPASM domain